MLQCFIWTSKQWNGWSPTLLRHCRCTKYSVHSALLAADTATEHTVEGLEVSIALLSENTQNGEKTWNIRCHTQFDLWLILPDLKLCRERLHVRCLFLTTNKMQKYLNINENSDFKSSVKWKSVYVRLKGSTSWNAFLYSLEIWLLSLPKVIALNIFLGIFGISWLLFQYLGYWHTYYDWPLIVQHLLTVHKLFAKTTYLVGTVSAEIIPLNGCQMLNLWIQLNLPIHKEQIVQNQLSPLDYTAGLQLKACIANGTAIAAYWYRCLSLRNFEKKKKYLRPLVKRCSLNNHFHYYPLLL